MFSDVQREMGLSLSCNSESIKRQTYLYLLWRHWVWRSQECSASKKIQYLSYSLFIKSDTVIRKWSRTSGDTPCLSHCRSCPSTSRCVTWTLDPFPDRVSTLRDLDAFQIDQPSSCWWIVQYGNPSILRLGLKTDSLKRAGALALLRRLLKMNTIEVEGLDDYTEDEDKTWN